MSRPSTNPYLIDEAISISISKLREWGYLKFYRVNTGITWSRNGIETSSVRILIIMTDVETSLTVNYKCNGNSYNYKIRLVSLPSNLGKGIVWYFLCPFTGKRCRKLHLINERFMHRSALPSAMYSCQTRSKTWRGWERSFGSYFETEKCYDEIYSKHFKKFYNGKPTKRYEKLIRRIELSDRLSHLDVEKLLL